MTGLTERQREVVRLVAEGYTDGQIATLIGCSEDTVGKHVAAVLKRLDARNRAHAAAMFARGEVPA